jgi:hypothetical protein
MSTSTISDRNVQIDLYFMEQNLRRIVFGNLEGINIDWHDFEFLGIVSIPARMSFYVLV